MHPYFRQGNAHHIVDAARVFGAVGSFWQKGATGVRPCGRTLFSVRPRESGARRPRALISLSLVVPAQTRAGGGTTAERCVHVIIMLRPRRLTRSLCSPVHFSNSPRPSMRSHKSSSHNEIVPSSLLGRGGSPVFRFPHRPSIEGDGAPTRRSARIAPGDVRLRPDHGARLWCVQRCTRASRRANAASWLIAFDGGRTGPAP